MTSSSRQPGPRLSFRQRLTWAAHFFKALAYQYHRDFGERVAGLIPSDAVIVDVGAHSGQFAKLFARLAPKGRVYAFEPGAYALSILRPVLRLRGFRNVVVVPLGLSDRPGSETLSLPLKKRGSVGFGLAHIGAEISGRTTIVQQIALTTLDAFAAEQGLARLDFIKVDIEGWEPHFLRGAAATLARFRPVVMIEVAQPAQPTTRHIGHTSTRKAMVGVSIALGVIAHVRVVQTYMRAAPRPSHRDSPSRCSETHSRLHSGGSESVENLFRNK